MPDQRPNSMTVLTSSQPQQGERVLKGLLIRDEPPVDGTDDQREEATSASDLAPTAEITKPARRSGTTSLA